MWCFILWHQANILRPGHRSLRRNIVGLHTKIKNRIMAAINIILGRADNYEIGYDNFIDQGYQLTLQYVLLGIFRLWAIPKGCDKYLWLGYPKGVISGYEWDILSVKWLWGLSVKHHHIHVETICYCYYWGPTHWKPDGLWLLYLC